MSEWKLVLYYKERAIPERSWSYKELNELYKDVDVLDRNPDIYSDINMIGLVDSSNKEYKFWRSASLKPAIDKIKYWLLFS